MIYIKIKGKKQYTSGIYCIKSHHGRIYIGSSSKIKGRYSAHCSDLKGNKHDNSRLQNYVNKYGICNLTFSCVELCDESQLIKREQYYIDKLNPYYNIHRVAGSSKGNRPWLGKKHSEETKAKIKKGVNAALANRQGVPKKIRPTRDENTAKLVALSRTKESRQKQSDRMKGHKYWLGKKHTQQTKDNRTGELNGRARAIICVETGQIFKTGIEASSYFNVGRPAICNSISRGNKIKGKFTLKYAND